MGSMTYLSYQASHCEQEHLNILKGGMLLGMNYMVANSSGDSTILTHQEECGF